MSFRKYIVIYFIFVNIAFLEGADKPEAPRVEYVVPLKKQPHEKDPSTIWYDDFNGKQKSYAEGNSPLDADVSFGGEGKSILCLYEKGKRGVGGRKVFFGDSPTYVKQTVHSDKKFDEIYWRIYVKHQHGWVGSPAKMSRATSLVSENWSQSMIAHVWSGSGSSLTLDPVRCVKGKKVLTSKYNDWKGMKWLGNKPVSKFPIHSTKESGYWVLVESYVKLNTPGKSDGVNQLWIDGRLECERLNLNFRDRYIKKGVNAVFLEAYWNKGSPATQSRWYDNFVISTKRIGPVICSGNVTVVKTSYQGNDKLGAWQVEVSEDTKGEKTIYKSKKISSLTRMTVNTKNGKFINELSDKKSLSSGKTYFLRVRQSNSKGVFSDWSRWHQEFRVE